MRLITALASARLGYTLVHLDSPEYDGPPSLEQVKSETTFFAHEELFNLSPDAILVTDAQGVIWDANPRALESFGYARIELIGQKLERLIPARFRRDHPSHRENFAAHPRTRQMGRAAMDLFALRKDGSEFPVNIMLKPAGTVSEPIVLSFIRDVTEQRAALEIVRGKDKQLRSIIESVRDYAIYLLDPGGYVMTWNRGGELIKGYTADEIMGKHFSRFFIPDDIERGRPAQLLRLAAMRGRVEEEGWRVRKDGSRFWTDSVLTAVRGAKREITGFAKITRDFEHRKLAEESVMMQLSNALLTTTDVNKLLGAISACIHDVIAHDSATLALYDAVTGELREQFLGPLDDDTSRRGGIGEVCLPILNSPAGEAFLTREPVVVWRMTDSSFSQESMRHLTVLGMQSGCWVPLLRRGEAIGTIMVASRSEVVFSQRDTDVLVQIASLVAMAINNAMAFRQISELRDRLRQEKLYLEEEINLDKHFEDIVGESAGLRRVLKAIETVAPTTATVLIQGETGTGKELLARAIHRLSPRNGRTFIKINCAAIPASLIESELFGHEKGAFTGAIARKIGRIELAHEGTLFLDEVGELPLDLQPKLLRALQEKEIERVGGNRPIPVDIRLIAATNRDLARMVAAKEFRSDLFYRLKVFPLLAPSLRERNGDIPILVRHFVSTHSRRMGKHIDTIPEQTMSALARWKWPGNIRELENFLERAVILTRGPVLYVPLSELEVEDQQEEMHLNNPSFQMAEREHIVRVLRDTGGQIGGPKGAAVRLGLKRTTLNSKMKKLGIAK